MLNTLLWISTTNGLALLLARRGFGFKLFISFGTPTPAVPQGHDGAGSLVQLRGVERLEQDNLVLHLGYHPALGIAVDDLALRRGCCNVACALRKRNASKVKHMAPGSSSVYNGRAEHYENNNADPCKPGVVASVMKVPLRSCRMVCT